MDTESCRVTVRDRAGQGLVHEPNTKEQESRTGPTADGAARGVGRW